jgi:phosphoribosylaminoimidazolecarboxamide formyltransferase/IMP cyclohydrolase
MSRRRALLSVSDKSGIEDFARELSRLGWELLSTGGTAARLRGAGLEVTEVAAVTGHPEMMEGRVKTLHPAIHAGLLARRDRADDMAALEDHGYAPIDLVAVNLYPFRETVARGEVGVGEAMEQVDIGGPTMIRAAAKNHAHVTVVVDPADYAAVVQMVQAEDGDSPVGSDGGTTSLRRRLAAKVFRHVSRYDAAVADFLEDGAEAANGALRIDAPVHEELRYGENPDQAATFHRLGRAPGGVAALKQLHGKALSYNNILDLDGALLTLAPFAWSPRPAVAIIKHTTPSGVAVGDTLAAAYAKALACDPVSAFGSVIAMNRPVDAEAAEALSSLFVECVVAPGFEEAALARLTGKKNLRLLVAPGIEEAVEGEPTSGPWAQVDGVVRGMGRFLARHSVEPLGRVFRSVYGGVLVQTPPHPPFYGVEDDGWRVVTKRVPTEREWDDLRFAWAASFGVKSNAIVLAQDGATVGIGAGQMSRVDSSRIAVRKAADAGLELAGAALASDAFFPFRDGVDAAAEAGVRAIVQPGGSIRDDEVVAAADEHDITMVFTGRRLFRH